jgi:division protein CdvB (Snf7/Vps24/ESCRT-III family)
MQFHTSRTENRSECSDYASMVANDLAAVFRMNSQFEHSQRLALDRVNLHLFGMVY